MVYCPPSIIKGDLGFELVLCKSFGVVFFDKKNHNIENMLTYINFT